MPTDRQESERKDRRKAPRCAQCGAGLLRVHRSDEDLRGELASASRRYRCVEASCGWEGLLPHGRRVPARAASEPGAFNARLWVLAGGLLVIFVMAAVAVGLLVFMPRASAAAPAAPAGTSAGAVSRAAWDLARSAAAGHAPGAAGHTSAAAPTPGA